MKRFAESAIVGRPPHEVFALAGDPQNDGQWSSSVLAARLTSPRPLGVGTTFEQTLRFLGRRLEIAGVVTEYEPDRKLVYEPTSGSMPVKYTRGARMFEEVEGGTRVTFVAEGRSGFFFNLAEPLVTWAARRAMRAGLSSLKKTLEARGEPGALSPPTGPNSPTGAERRLA